MDESEIKMSSAESSDHEADPFEDATDSVSDQLPGVDRSRSAASPSVRSLTGDPPSSSSSSKTRRPSQLTPDRRSSSSVSNRTPRVSQMPGMLQSDGSDSDMEDITSPKLNGKQQSTSPLLTARRVSNFDDVHLSEVKENGEPRGRSTTTSSNASSRSQSRSSVSATRLRSSNISSAVPTIASIAAPAKSQPPIPMSRKLSSPFAWLSRKKTTPQGDTPTAPPQTNFRRNTAASTTTIGSNPDMMLSRLDEEKAGDHLSISSKAPARESLKERFKALRLKEEVGIELESKRSFSMDSEARSPDLGLGIGGSERVLESEEKAIVGSPTGTEHGMSSTFVASRSNSIASNFDPHLAPGTVSGLSAGPSAMQDPEAPVDWDLWQSVVYEGPVAVAKTSAAELNRAIASGIPSAIRGVVWQVLAQSKNEELEGVYHELVVRGTDKEFERDSPTMSSGPHSANSLNSNGTAKESLASSASSIHSEQSTPATTNGMTSPTLSQDMDIGNTVKSQAAMAAERQKRTKDDAATIKKLEKTIRKDLGSRSNYSKYAVAVGLQEGLFGVCKAYALFDEGVGYAQGMNFIVMPLLFNMSEEEAFCLLVRLMNQYGLRDMFVKDMPGLHLHLYQFERLLEDVEPALCYHLHKRGINPELYATQWFLTLFAYRFPLQLVLRVYDLVLSEGLEGAILKFGIALMQKNAETLLGIQDMVALKTFLNERLFDVYIDQTPSASSILESGFFGSSGGMDKQVYRADLLVQDACAVNISPELLKTYTSDYEARIRLEKEREAEVESLKSANTSLSIKVRSLEQRAEKSDTDHVQMATEMIRSKMENEELRAANRELMLEIENLKNIVESQPAEVEAKLKEEMERIMQRNIEVQNENRAIEEQLADMERELVETKMRYAEINSDHDTLKQRWNDLRKALED